MATEKFYNELNQTKIDLINYVKVLPYHKLRTKLESFIIMHDQLLQREQEFTNQKLIKSHVNATTITN